MALIFNLDLDNKKKVSSYGFDSKKNPFPTFYFRLYQNGYDADISKFTSIVLRIRGDSSNTSKTHTFTKVVSIDGESLVEIKLDDGYLNNNEKLFIEPTVRYSGKVMALTEFEFLIYKKPSVEMDAAKRALEKFNDTYNLYLKAVKRDQINETGGVIGLDENAKIDKSRLPNGIGSHIEETILNHEVHGLRLNDKYMLEYWDAVEKRFVTMNSINGGLFGKAQKQENGIFGGNFTEKQDSTKSIFGGTFK